MARPTDDKKESKVILRINDEMRKSLEELAKEDNISLSECIRRILGDVVMKGNTSTISRPRTVRIKNEAVEYFEGKPLNRMIESLMEYMERGQIEYGEGGLEVKGAFMVDEAIVKDLKMIGEMYDMTFDDMFEELHRAIDEGEIDIEDGRFVYPKVEEKA